MNQTVRNGKVKECEVAVGSTNPVKVKAAKEDF
jgi:hypothetical protein